MHETLYKRHLRVCVLVIGTVSAALIYMAYWAAHVAKPSSRLAFPVHSRIAPNVPEFECTQSSGLCDCITRPISDAGIRGRIFKQLVRSHADNCVSESKPSAVVEVDPDNWLVLDVNLGRYDCRFSRCTLRRSTSLDQARLADDVDAYVTAAPSEHLRIKSSFQQRMVLLSMESTARYPQYADSQWLYRSNFTDVLSLHPVTGFSSFEISYAHMDIDYLFYPPWPTSAKINGVALFISNCDTSTRTNRLELIKALNESGIPLYSFGQCQQTHRAEVEFPECATQTRQGAFKDFVKLCVMRRFKFAAAFENDVTPGYVTEKLLHALIAGTVPIYAGTGDVRRILPAANAAIVLNAFNSTDAATMVSKVKALLKDDEAYNDALTWKYRGKSMLPSRLLRMFRNSYGRLACILCDNVVMKQTNS